MQCNLHNQDRTPGAVYNQGLIPAKLADMRIDEIHPSGWRPDRADGFDSRLVATWVRPGSVSPGVLARWLLLCAVIAGVFLLHVLTAENNHSAHGTVSSPAITAVSQSATPGPGLQNAPEVEVPVVMVPAVSGAVPPPGGGDGGDLSECILFLVVTAATAGVLLLLQRGRADGSSLTPPSAGGVIARRAPQSPMVQRLFLGVIRV